MSDLKFSVDGTQLTITCDVSKLAQMNARPTKAMRMIANAAWHKIEAPVCPGLMVDIKVLCAKADATPKAVEAPAPKPLATDAATQLAQLGLNPAQILKLLSEITPAPLPEVVVKKNGAGRPARR